MRLRALVGRLALVAVIAGALALALPSVAFADDSIDWGSSASWASVDGSLDSAPYWASYGGWWEGD
jgi:hypothetical protein